MASLTAQTIPSRNVLGFHQRHSKLYTEGMQKLLIDFQEQRPSCQEAAALRQQLEANGGRMVAERRTKGTAEDAPPTEGKLIFYKKKILQISFSKRKSDCCA